MHFSIFWHKNVSFPLSYWRKCDGTCGVSKLRCSTIKPSIPALSFGVCPARYCTLLNKHKCCENFPALPWTHSGGPSSLGGTNSASSGASFLNQWRLVVLPACKHSIHLSYERLSQMWWLIGELRAGMLPPQGSKVKLARKRRNTEGLPDLITIQIESTWQPEQNKSSTLQTILAPNENIHYCIPTHQFLKRTGMIYFSILAADLQTSGCWCRWDQHIWVPRSQFPHSPFSRPSMGSN